MDSMRRLRAAAASASALVVSAAFLAAGGCNPRKDQLRPEGLFGRIGRQDGQVIEPRKCMIRVAILERPLRDPAINDLVWRAADEQAVPPEARRALEANGLRLGQITGELPPELEAVLQAPPPHQVEPASFLLDDGEQTLISVGEAVDQATLLLNRQGRASGRDYEAASGFFRVNVAHSGASGVSLRFTPEIHHGAVQRSYQPLPGATPYAPQQFKISDGQQEEALRDLSASLTLEHGQVAVLGCRPEQEGSLGAFLLTRSGGRGDQRRQKLILFWASRNQLGAAGEKPDRSDRPLPGPRPAPKAAKPAAARRDGPSTAPVTGAPDGR